jgi:hypothetical protein
MTSCAFFDGDSVYRRHFHEAAARARVRSWRKGTIAVIIPTNQRRFGLRLVFCESEDVHWHVATADRFTSSGFSDLITAGQSAIVTHV